MTTEQPEDELPPMDESEERIVTGNVEVMSQINTVLFQAVQHYIDDRIRRKIGGIDSTSLILAVHNFHKLVIVGAADDMYRDADPMARKHFYTVVRDEFHKAMTELITSIENAMIKDAITETDARRKGKGY